MLSFTPASPLSDGTHILYVRDRGNGEWSETTSSAALIDTVAPQAPVVSAAATTDPTRPQWNWTTPEETAAFRIQVDGEAEGGWTETASQTVSYQPVDPLTLSSHTLYVLAGDSAGNWSTSGHETINLDPLAPEFLNTPAVSGNSLPTWSWTTPANAVGFEIQLDGTGGTWIAKAIEDTHFTPGTALGDGPHTLSLRAVMQNGVRSSMSQFTITVDTTPPVPPAVSGPASTQDRRPQWTWSEPADAVQARYSLDTEGPGWTVVDAGGLRAFQPSGDLSLGSHTFFVQASDLAGNWSSSGSSTAIICPPMPVVNGTAVSNISTPTWTWVLPAGTTEVRYQLDGTTGSWTSVGPSVPGFTAFALAEGSHTLYVKAVADGGESPTAQFTTVVDTKAPNAPVVSGTSPTAEKRPLWIWTLPADPAPGTGVDMFRFQLDGSGAWTEVGTSVMQYRLTEDLLTPRTLFVQARDQAGNWSASGSFKITPVWTLDTVDTSANDRSPSIVVNDLTGNPLISYVDTGTKVAWLASWDGTSWLKRTVISNAGTLTSLGLDVNDSNRHPHVLVSRDTNKCFDYLRDEGQGTFAKYVGISRSSSPYENTLSLSTAYTAVSGQGQDMGHVLFTTASGEINLFRLEWSYDSSTSSWNLRYWNSTPSSLTGEYSASFGYNQSNAVDELLTLTGSVLRSRLYVSGVWQASQDIAAVATDASSLTSIPRKLTVFSGTSTPQAWVACSSSANEVLLVKRNASGWASPPLTIHQGQSAGVTSLAVEVNPADPTRAAVVYIANGTLYCATSDGVTSVEEVVDSGVADTASVAVSPTGVIHIAYKRTGSGSLMHAVRPLP